MSKRNKHSKSDHEPSEDESTAGKECTLCHDVPERIIYLSCDHIICLVCATKLIISESDEKDIDFSEVKCGLCGEATALSKEVQETLLEFLNSGDFQLDSDEEEEGDVEDEEEEQEEDEDDHDIQEVKNAHKKKEKKIVEREEEEDEDEENEERDDNEDDNEDHDADEEEQSKEEGEEEEEEFVTSFGCQVHDGEEYSYYNSNTRTLFCTQCLLNSKLQQTDLSGFKPLKKCFPEILQGFQDMINEVEVCRNLLDNKRKDFEIRKENAKSQCQSNIRKYELVIEELIDNLQEQKARIAQNLESKLEKILNEEDSQENSIETRVDYFNAIIDQIGGFKQGDNPEEEIFGFFFANQEKIYSALHEERSYKYDEKPHFRDFESSVKAEHDKSLHEFYTQAMTKIQKASEQFRPKRESHTPSVINDEGRRVPDANFSHFIQKIRQQSASLKDRPATFEEEKPLNRSKFNWNERQSKEKVSTNTNFFNKTMERSTVQKLDIEKKMKLLDFRSRKEDYMQSVNTVTNFRKGKDSITNKLEELKQQLRSRPGQSHLSSSYKFK